MVVEFAEVRRKMRRRQRTWRCVQGAYGYAGKEDIDMVRSREFDMVRIALSGEIGAHLIPARYGSGLVFG